MYAPHIARETEVGRESGLEGSEGENPLALSSWRKKDCSLVPSRLQKEKDSSSNSTDLIVTCPKIPFFAYLPFFPEVGRVCLGFQLSFRLSGVNVCVCERACVCIRARAQMYGQVAVEIAGVGAASLNVIYSDNWSLWLCKIQKVCPKSIVKTI